MKIEVNIRKVFSNSGVMKAVASVTFDGQYVVHGVRVIETPKGRFISMPSTINKDKDGSEKHHDIFHPVSSSARREMESAVLTAYENAIRV